MSRNRHRLSACGDTALMYAAAYCPDVVRGRDRQGPPANRKGRGRECHVEAWPYAASDCCVECVFSNRRPRRQLAKIRIAAARDGGSKIVKLLLDKGARIAIPIQNCDQFHGAELGGSESFTINCSDTWLQLVFRIDIRGLQQFPERGDTAIANCPVCALGGLLGKSRRNAGDQ